MAETEWTKHVCSVLEKLGAEWFPIVGGLRGRNGLPDRVFVCNFGNVLCEFKGPVTVVKPHQFALMARFTRRNCDVYFYREIKGDSERAGVLFDGDYVKLCDRITPVDLMDYWRNRHFEYHVSANS